MLLPQLVVLGLVVLFGVEARNHTNQSLIEPCFKDSGVRCNVWGRCDAFIGPAQCNSNKCMCADNYCALGNSDTNPGTCELTCQHRTEGTCRVLGCARRRNAICHHGVCVCKHNQCSVLRCVDNRGGTVSTDPSDCKKPNFVADVGVCVPKCAHRTGGSCRLFKCSEYRYADCVKGECVCPRGQCAVTGVCWDPSACDTNTGGTCSIFGCDASRGETLCLGGKCLCRPGYCQKNGRCSRERGDQSAGETRDYTSFDVLLGSLRFEVSFAGIAGLLSGTLAALVAVKMMHNRNSGLLSMNEPMLRDPKLP